MMSKPMFLLAGLVVSVGVACGGSGGTHSPQVNDSSIGDAPMDAPASPGFGVYPAVMTTNLVGRVVDEAGKPVPKAMLISGGSSATTDALGAFTLTTKTGRVTLTVTADGFLDSTRLISVTSKDVSRTLRLVSKPSAQVVSSAGATLISGKATLTYAPGAYAVDTKVVVRWIPPALLGSMSLPIRWIDAGGTARKSVGIVHVSAASEPAVPVTVKVPVSPRATMTTVAYYPADASGALQTPIAPTSVEGGFATFLVPHFDDGAAAEEADPESITPTSGASSTRSADGATGSAEPGSDDIPSGTTVTPSGDEPAVYEEADGTEVTVTTGEVEMEAPATGPASANCLNSNCTVRVATSVVRGSGAPPDHTAVRFVIKSKTCSLGVRGTVVSLSATTCKSNSREIIDAEVPEGAVDFSGGGFKFDRSLVGGERLSGCEDCENPEVPTCCDRTNCTIGCCVAGGLDCLPGKDLEACGTRGGACGKCLPSEQCYFEPHGGTCRDPFDAGPDSATLVPTCPGSQVQCPLSVGANCVDSAAQCCPTLLDDPLSNNACASGSTCAECSGRLTCLRAGESCPNCVFCNGVLQCAPQSEARPTCVACNGRMIALREGESCCPGGRYTLRTDVCGAGNVCDDNVNPCNAADAGTSLPTCHAPAAACCPISDGHGGFSGGSYCEAAVCTACGCNPTGLVCCGNKFCTPTQSCAVSPKTGGLYCL